MRPKSRTMHMRILLLLCALFGAWLTYGVQAQPIQSSAPMAGAVINRSTLNGSVTITTGGTFQQILPSIVGNVAAVRQSLTIQNNNGNATCEAASNCDYCWVYIGTGTASEGKSIQLAAGQAYTRYWPYVPSDVIQATCTTSSDTLYVDTQ